MKPLFHRIRCENILGECCVEKSGHCGGPDSGSGGLRCGSAALIWVLNGQEESSFEVKKEIQVEFWIHMRFVPTALSAVEGLCVLLC